MRKSRDKYLKDSYNNDEIYCKIISKSKFTPYEFMALRYTCCSRISFLMNYSNFSKSCSVVMNYEEYKQFNIKRKHELKLLQKSISYLDNCYTYRK